MSSTCNKKKKKSSKKNKTLTPPSTSFNSAADNDSKNLTVITGETPSLVTAGSESAEHEDSIQASTKDSSLEQRSGVHESPNESGYPITPTETRKVVGSGSSHAEHMSSTEKKSRKRKAKKTSDMKSGLSQVSNLSECSFTFEEQVEWCIGQLELGLLRPDASKAQKDSNEKNIKTLRSLKVPVPRKR